MRVYDQLHPEAETSTRKVHDEQRPRKLYNLTGMSYKSQIPASKLSLVTGIFLSVGFGQNLTMYVIAILLQMSFQSRIL